VSNSDDLDVFATQPVNQAEGIERKDVPTSMPPMTWPHERVAGDDIHGMSELFAKGMGGKDVSGGVPVIGGFRLLRGSRVEPDRCPRHSATV
jgi:hypothetical protein